MFLKQKRQHENNATEKSTRPVWKMNLQCVCQEGWAPGARFTKETVAAQKDSRFQKKLPFFCQRQKQNRCSSSEKSERKEQKHCSSF